MKGHGTIVTIAPDGTITRKDVGGRDSGTLLPHLQEACGGYVETVPYFDRWADPDAKQTRKVVVFCHEEGKLEGQPYNAVATAAWQEAILPHRLDDFLVGRIAIVFGDAAFMRDL